MKVKKKVIISTIVVLAVIGVLVGIFSRLRITKEEGVLRVGNSILFPYAYAIHEDHVVLEEYHGDEEVVKIPETIWGKPVTEIGRCCFERNSNIRIVELTKYIEVIGNQAFFDCENLTEVIGGENVITIDSLAFEVCRKLENVEIGDKLERIGVAAFSRCIALEKIAPQDNLLIIENYAFDESGVEEFLFSKQADVGAAVFQETNWIHNQPEEFVIYGDGNLIGYNGTEERVVIPDGVKKLNGDCFAGTTAKEIYLPDTVTIIQEYVFTNCDDIRLYIPDSVTLMGDEEGRFPMIMSDDVDLTIITTQDSCAHKYAIEHDIPVEIVEGW